MRLAETRRAELPSDCADVFHARGWRSLTLVPDVSFRWPEISLRQPIHFLSTLMVD